MHAYIIICRGKRRQDFDKKESNCFTSASVWFAVVTYLIYFGIYNFTCQNVPIGYCCFLCFYLGRSLLALAWHWHIFSVYSSQNVIFEFYMLHSFHFHQPSQFELSQHDLCSKHEFPTICNIFPQQLQLHSHSISLV